MSIDGALVDDNDGLHGPTPLSANTTLTAGRHAIEVVYFERAGAETLLVQWAGPGVAQEAIPAAVLTTAP
jgi:hypothetical protein